MFLFVFVISFLPLVSLFDPFFPIFLSPELFPSLSWSLYYSVISRGSLISLISVSSSLLYLPAVLFCSAPLFLSFFPPPSLPSPTTTFLSSFPLILTSSPIFPHPLLLFFFFFSFFAYYARIVATGPSLSLSLFLIDLSSSTHVRAVSTVGQSETRRRWFISGTINVLGVMVTTWLNYGPIFLRNYSTVTEDYYREHRLRLCA